jgi:hypothetical protein
LRLWRAFYPYEAVLVVDRMHWHLPAATASLLWRDVHERASRVFRTEQVNTRPTLRSISKARPITILEGAPRIYL